MKNKISFIVVIAIFFFVKPVFAQTALNKQIYTEASSYALSPESSDLGNHDSSVNIQNIKSDIVQIATVNIYDAKISSQRGNDFLISFDLNNKEDVQPQIIYSVGLITRSDEKNVIDQKIYSEDVLSLGGGETIHKDVLYTAPASLNGEYDLFLESRDRGGLLFAKVLVGSVKLNGGGDFIELSSCYLTVKGESFDKKYSINQGVDVDADEFLIAHCNAKSNFEGTIPVTPNFTNYYRTIFGENLGNSDLPRYEIKYGENEDLQFIIAKPKDPQAYEAVLVLKDSNGKVISNSVNFKYIIHGLSATIYNVKFDKNIYNAGEKSKISFLWYASADYFSHPRKQGTDFKNGSIEISLFNDAGKLCADVFKKNVSINEQGIPMEITLVISNTCKNPLLKGKIFSSEGALLAQDNFSAKVKQESESSVVKIDDNSVKNKNGVYVKLIIFVILLVLVSFLLIYFYKKKKGISKISIILLFFLINCGFFFANMASANTYTFSYDCGDGAIIHFNVNLSLNKDSYLPGERIWAGGKFDGTSWCTNCRSGAYSDYNIVGEMITIDGKAYAAFGFIFTGDPKFPTRFVDGIQEAYVPATAPLNPGTYNINFNSNLYSNWPLPVGRAFASGFIFPIEIPYVVENIPPPAPIDGVCGSSSGKVFKTAPTSDFCAAGKKAAFSGDNPWYWYCVGQNGGATVACLTSNGKINGMCGLSNGKLFSSAPTSDFCLTGTPTAITTIDKYWYWDCIGEDGGLTSNCVAELLLIDAKCGSSAGKLFSTIPTSDFCEVGSLADISGNNPWTWRCLSPNGGNSAFCHTASTSIYPVQCSDANGQYFTETDFAKYKIFADPNGDGVVTNNDAIELFQKVQNQASMCTLDTCDVTPFPALDGVVNLNDLTAINKITVGLAPTKLCNKGIQSAITNTSTGWNWSCKDWKNTVPDANCMANKKTDDFTLTVIAEEGTEIIGNSTGVNISQKNSSDTYLIKKGALVNLEAKTETTFFAFDKWEGGTCTGNNAICNFSMNSNITVRATAKFKCSCGDYTNYCPEETWTGTCGNSCSGGTKSCPSYRNNIRSWREVAP